MRIVFVMLVWFPCFAAENEFFYIDILWAKELHILKRCVINFVNNNIPVTTMLNFDSC